MAIQRAVNIVALSLTLTFTLLLLIVGYSPLCTADYTLESGETLKSGESLNRGSNTLIMQSDCNLVMYHSGKPVWASNTGGKGINCYATLQIDGKLAIFNDKNKVLWSSNFFSNKGYVLILQKDGNVVVYGGVEKTNTGPVGVSSAIATHETNAARIAMVVNN